MSDERQVYHTFSQWWTEHEKQVKSGFKSINEQEFAFLQLMLEKSFNDGDYAPEPIYTPRWRAL